MSRKPIVRQVTELVTDALREAAQPGSSGVALPAELRAAADELLGCNDIQGITFRPSACVPGSREVSITITPEAAAAARARTRERGAMARKTRTPKTGPHVEGQQKLGEEFPDIATEDRQLFEVTRKETYSRGVVVWAKDHEEALTLGDLAIRGLAPEGASEDLCEKAAAAAPQPSLDGFTVSVKTAKV